MTLEDRVAKLDETLQQEIEQRIRADHEFRHRLFYIEENCLKPALSRKIYGPIPWLSKLLGLSWRPPRRD
jgi:hypothetical protein